MSNSHPGGGYSPCPSINSGPASGAEHLALDVGSSLSEDMRVGQLIGIAVFIGAIGLVTTLYGLFAWLKF